MTFFSDIKQDVALCGTYIIGKFLFNNGEIDYNYLIYLI